MAGAKKQNPIWRVLFLIMTAAVLGVSVYSWNARMILGNPMPMPFGYGVSVVLSGSMEPALQVDDLVVVRRSQDVEAEDIIVFQSGKSLVIHRVVKVDGQTLITKGDANNAEDEPISLSDVKGELVLRIPGAGKAIGFLQKPVVAGALLCLALLLTERSYRKEKKTGNDELEAIRQEIESLMEELKEEKE